MSWKIVKRKIGLHWLNNSC